MRTILIACVAGVLAWAGLANADCSSSSICTTRHGRTVCSSEQHCTVRRAPVCSYQTRCVPQRTCVSRPGMSSCVTRDVCRSERICI
jgi:hypothetical protein